MPLRLVLALLRQSYHCILLEYATFQLVDFLVQLNLLHQKLHPKDSLNRSLTHHYTQIKKPVSVDLQAFASKFFFPSGERGIRTLGTSYPVQRFSRPSRSTAPASLQNVTRDHRSLVGGRGGERGIRTPGTSQFNGFQDRRIRPLCHFSAAKVDSFFVLQKSRLKINNIFPPEPLAFLGFFSII